MTPTPPSTFTVLPFVLNLGGEIFAESIDYFRTCWFIKLFERYAPLQKKILVDLKDIDIFYSLYRDCPGNKIVAVVNQW